MKNNMNVMLHYKCTHYIINKIIITKSIKIQEKKCKYYQVQVYSNALQDTKQIFIIGICFVSYNSQSRFIIPKL